MNPLSPDPSVTDLTPILRAMLSIQRASWEQGVAAQALLELGERDLVMLLAQEAVLRQLPDGRLAGLASEDAVTDPAANGEPLLAAARWTGDAGLAQAAQRMLDYLMVRAPRTRDGVLHHVLHAPQVWVDSLYMAPPFLAAAGLPAEAFRQVEGMRRLLWNPQARLFSHIWDEAHNALVRPAFWGVGNGWAAAGMTRVLAALPAEMTVERAQLQTWILEVLEGCLAHQRPDGLFHNIVNDPSSFVETNLAQMLAYTIYRGLSAGWLAQELRPPADRMRAAAHAKVDPQGWVRDVCGSPDFDHPGTAAEGQAFFLLMEAAYRDHRQTGDDRQE